MTVERARAWTAGLGSSTRRGALVVAGVAAFGISVAGDTGRCSPADPSVCGPDPTFAAAIVLAFAAVVLVWWRPLEAAGCAIAFALLDLGFDDVLAANIAWTLLAVLHVWHVVVLRREDTARRRVLLDAFVALPVVPSGRDPGVAVGVRHVAVGALLAVSVAGLGFFALDLRSDAAHEGRAVDAPAKVVAVVDGEDGAAYRLRLDRPVPGVPPEPVVTTLDEYDVGDAVLARVDPTDATWTHLVAEPPDRTWWVSLAGGALLLALVVGRPLLTGRVRRGALLAHPPSSGVPVRWLDVDDSPLPVIATDRDVVVAELETVGGPRLAADGPARLEHRVRSGWLVGDVRDGGWCALVHPGGTELPAAPLVALGGLPSIDDAFLDPDLQDDVAAWSEPVAEHVAGAELPVALSPSVLDRAVGAAAALAATVAGVWVLGWDEASWWQAIGVCLSVLSAAHWGMTRLLSCVHVGRDRLRLVDAVWRHHVPMGAVADVRVAGDDLVVLLWDKRRGENAEDADDAEDVLVLGPWGGGGGARSRTGPSAAAVAAAVADLRPVVRPSAAVPVSRQLSAGAAVLALVAAVLFVRYLTVFVL